MKVITLHVNVSELVATLVQTLPGITVADRLLQEKKKQFYVLRVLVKITMERTDVKLKVMGIH